MALPIPAAPSPQAQQLRDNDSPWRDGLLLWAVPKKKTSHSKKRMRSTHKYLKPRSDYITCPQCNNLKLLHMLCGHCLKLTLQATATTRNTEQSEQQ